MAAISEGDGKPVFTHESKTLADILKNQPGISRLITEIPGQCKTSVIVLCESSGSEGSGPEGLRLTDERPLKDIPHVVLQMDDDLLRKIKELQEENEKLRSLSLIDNLTGLGNKRYFWMQLETEMARTKRTGLVCTLMMIDLDNFKGLNDTFGHLEGDKFLEGFGRIIHDNSRSTDLPCRYGGDEFALIMPATSVAEAIKTGERLKKKLSDMEQKSDPPISLSMGISEYTAFSSYTMDEFMSAADGALYEAKASGKNQICIDRNWKGTSFEDNEVSKDEKDALFGNYE